MSAPTQATVPFLIGDLVRKGPDGEPRRIVAIGPTGTAIRLESPGSPGGKSGWLHAYNYELVAAEKAARDKQVLADLNDLYEDLQHDRAELVTADLIAAALDPLCTWLGDDDEECGSDRTLFVVADAFFDRDTGVAAVYDREGVIVCAAHLPGVITTRDNTIVEPGASECSLVVPITEHPLRGRPPEAVRKAAGADGSASLDMVGA